MNEEREGWIHSVKKHLAEYQKKVNLSSQSFSVKELAGTLKEISSTTQQRVNSVHQLKRFIESTESGEYDAEEDGSKMDRLIMYSNWFLDNLQYLKELKSQFDMTIYIPLKEANKSTFGALAESSVLEFKDDINELKELCNDSNTDNLISRLKYLHDRLEYLLEDEGEVDPVFFSLTSAQSLERNSQANESFVRLIPDILRKMSIAGDLAGQWLHTMSSPLSTTTNRHDKLVRVKTILLDRLSSVTGQIEHTEKELDCESGELQTLLEREDRSTLIAERGKSVELKLTKLHERIVQTDHQIADIQDLVQTAGGNDKFTTKLVTDLKKKQRLYDEMNQKIRVLKYEKNLVEEDLGLELEIKPNLIRLTNGLQDKCEQLEVALEVLQKEKERLERALKPIVDDSVVVES